MWARTGVAVRCQVFMSPYDRIVAYGSLVPRVTKDGRAVRRRTIRRDYPSCLWLVPIATSRKALLELRFSRALSHKLMRHTGDKSRFALTTGRRHAVPPRRPPNRGYGNVTLRSLGPLERSLAMWLSASAERIESILSLHDA